MKKSIAILLTVVAFCIASYNLRAFVPSSGYVARLTWLQGWKGTGYYGFNCSGYLANAHGETFISESDFFSGDSRTVRLFSYSNRNAIDESKIEPGDIAAYQGPAPFQGVHVAAYLGGGLWVDSDARRGTIAAYRLANVAASDDWFKGEVRIYRWKSSPNIWERTRNSVTFFTAMNERRSK